MKRFIAAVIFVSSILLMITFTLSGCSRKLSDVEAVELLNKKTGVNITADSANVISADYSTNIREYSFLIVVEIDSLNTDEIVRALKLLPTTLSEAAKNGLTNELTSILTKYFNNDELFYCRYEYGHLLNGEEHTASVYLIVLSAKGRLLLYEDI